MVTVTTAATTDHYRRLAAAQRTSGEALGGRMLRRTVLAVLLRAGVPLDVGEVLGAISAQGYTVKGQNPRRRVAQALAHEHNRGWARRVDVGTYTVGRLSKTSRWRILHERPRPRPRAPALTDGGPRRGKPACRTGRATMTAPPAGDGSSAWVDRG